MEQRQASRMEDEDEETCIPMSDQRTIYLVNIFIGHTARFLNRFSALCEQKLADVHRRILRMEVTLTLLESKLKSVEGLEEGMDPSFFNTPPASSSSDGVSEPASDPVIPSSETVQLPLKISETSERQQGPGVSPSTLEQHLQMLGDDHKLSRFFRMLRVGVPEQAVKMQMSIEGLDPTLLKSTRCCGISKLNGTVEIPTIARASK